MKQQLRPSATFAKEYFDRPIVVVEIGTYLGNNARSMLEHMNIEKLYIIDPYERYEQYTCYPDKDFEKVYHAAQKKLASYENKIVWIKKHSNSAINDIPQADYIYIDGNHSYEYVLNDMQNYWPKIKNNGILAGHDIANKKSVKKAYDQFLTDIKIEKVVEVMKKESKIQTFETTPDWWIIKQC